VILFVANKRKKNGVPDGNKKHAQPSFYFKLLPNNVTKTITFGYVFVRQGEGGGTIC
jgi:hypothetical protein